MISVVKTFNFFVLSFSLLLAGCFFNKTDEQKIHELQGNVFGAYYIIKYRGELEPQKFKGELEHFFLEFNQEFSTYQTDSVISEFNRTASNSPLKVSSRFIEMIKLAQKFYEQTEGAFDPTLGPVIKLWGFGGGAKKSIPHESELTKARSLVGFNLIKWDEEKQLIWKTKTGVQLDINAFAPGWVCDLIGPMLSAYGIEHFMIDMSGEILFKGTKGESSPWVAGVEKPSPNRAEGIQQAFKMRDLAIATSGNYRQFFNAENERKSHIIDPRTGKPVTHSISSASVIASNGASADVWSTAMMVLGPSGIDLAEKNGIKVLLLDAKNPELFEEIVSPSWGLFTQDQRL
jgi:thiamine biosynthesis lipoprotein